MDPTHASVDGVVRGPDGTRIDGALVAVVSTSENLAESASTVSHGGGRFRFAGIRPGPYAITATAPGLTAARVDLSELEAGKPRTAVPVVLGGEGVTVRGVVLDPAGRPVSGILVRLVRGSDVKGDLFLARTDARGAYEAMLPKARYDVRVQAPDMEPFQEATAGIGDETVDVSFSPAPPSPPTTAAGQSPGRQQARVRRAPLPPVSPPPSAKSCTIAPLCAPR